MNFKLKDRLPDNAWVGLLVGLLFPVISFFIYYGINYSYMSIEGLVRYFVLGNVLTHVVSLCALTDLGVFYLFIQFEKYRSSRGIILSVFLYTAFVVYLKYF